MDNVISEENVLVGKGGSRDLRADVIHPADQTGIVPGILLLPGGAFRNADRAPLRERYSLALAAHGYVCVNAEYRVMDEASWPAQIQDVKANIRWMRANSVSLRIDPSRIVVVGKSAGGLLALLAGGSQHVQEFEGTGGNPGISSEVAAVVGISPVTDLSERARMPEFEPLFGPAPTEQLVTAGSPISYANETYRPALLFLGTSDTRVHHSATMRMYDALERAGVPVDLHLYAGQDHFFDREPHFYQAVTEAIKLFMVRYVAVQDMVAAS